MAPNIHGKMVYSFEKPMWHNIVEPSFEKRTAEQIMVEEFKGGFALDLRQPKLFLNGEWTDYGKFEIVRTASPYDQQEVVFGQCSERYLPLQPMDVAKSFDMNVREYVETMAFMGKGQEMFICWQMPSFEGRPGDEYIPFGVVRCGFDTLKGAKLMTTIYRPVCANTIAMAQGWAERNSDGAGKGMIWKGKAVNKNLLRDLGYWMKHVQENAIVENMLLQAFIKGLAETPITGDAEVKSILEDAYPNAENVTQYYPVELRPSREQTTLDFNNHQQGIRDGIFQLWAGDGTAITPDLGGVLNATSEYYCHVQPSKRPIAESVMFGPRQKAIMQMVSTLNARMGLAV